MKRLLVALLVIFIAAIAALTLIRRGAPQPHCKHQARHCRGHRTASPI